jgi:two-component system NtrC family sensor kinase
MNLPRTPWLVLSMAAAIAAVAALAFWDQQREAALALEEFAEQQSTLAVSVGSELSARLEAARHDASLLGLSPQARTISSAYLATRIRAADEPALPLPDAPAVRLSIPLGDGRVVDLATPTANLLPQLDRAGSQRLLLLLPPRAQSFYASDGRKVAAEELREAIEAGLSSARLSQSAAARLGLPPRTALAGLAVVNDPLLGRWGGAVATPARRERDRARRANTRLLLSTVLAGGLVLLFGGFALRERAKELEVSRSLSLEQLAREREVRLDREGRAATVITLASGVAHELATPLGVIVGRAEQLRTRVHGDERGSKAVQAIIDQAEGIREVIRGFLGLARGSPPALTSLHPREIAQSALALVEHRFTKAGVRLSAQVADELPRIACDPRLLGHALVNLLLNACDACSRGGAVELRAESRKGSVAFVVSDDGEGISDAIAARATEPFFTTKSPDRGTGLGLAIANEIVKTHRGSLTIGRGEQRGTRVSIEIPLAGEDA